MSTIGSEGLLANQALPELEDLTEADEQLRFMWLELTGKCDLACVHCYAESSPSGTHGTMEANDWKRVISQGADMGVKTVQFIGGEPTLHPDLPELVDHSLETDLSVEIFSNLTHISPRQWGMIDRKGVSLATSYYSSDPSEHEAITTSKGSYDRTRRNIGEAIMREIPLRVGIIGVQPGQNIEGALADLDELGVPRDKIKIDYLRQVGRGVRDREATVKELCGRCATGVAAILPDGTVAPCVFSRWIDTGNVQESDLSSIVRGDAFADARNSLRREFTSRPVQKGKTVSNNHAPATNDCSPGCDPNCWPSTAPCSPDCGPSTNPCAPDSYRCGPDNECPPSE